MNLLSPATIAKEFLDCSTSQFYKEVKAGTFPPPDKKLWGDSTRGWRWYRATVERFIAELPGTTEREDAQDDEQPYVAQNLDKILKHKLKRDAA